MIDGSGQSVIYIPLPIKGKSPFRICNASNIEYLN